MWTLYGLKRAIRQTAIWRPLVDLETARNIISLLETGENFAIVTMMDTRGSSPRHTGAAMLVRPDGSIKGTVGGGALEGLAVRKARQTLESGSPALVEFELTDQDSAGLGMICGGRGIFLVDYVDPTDARTLELYTALVGLLASGDKGWLVSSLTKEPAVGGADEREVVHRCLVTAEGAVFGDPACPAEVLRELTKRGGTYDHAVADAPLQTFLEPVGGLETAFVFGAGHCGEKLVPLLNVLGFHTTVVDDRVDFANAQRFPTVDSISVVESFAHSLEQLPVDGNSFIVILTRGHVYDREVLAQALRTDARYIGMIGSRKKVEGVFQALREQGFSEDDLARVHAPIGVSIGAETPEEIAVSICAQLIQVRRGQDT